MSELLALVVDDLGCATGSPRAALTPLSDIAGTVAPWFVGFIHSVESAHVDDVRDGDREMAQRWSEGLAALGVYAERHDAVAAASSCEALSLSLRMVTAADAGVALSWALAPVLGSRTDSSIVVPVGREAVSVGKTDDGVLVVNVDVDPPEAHPRNGIPITMEVNGAPVVSFDGHGGRHVHPDPDGCVDTAARDRDPEGPARSGARLRRRPADSGPSRRRPSLRARLSPTAWCARLDPWRLDRWRRRGPRTVWGLSRKLSAEEVGDILLAHQCRLRSASYDDPPVLELRAADRAIRRNRWSRDTLVYDAMTARRRRAADCWDDAPF